MRAADRAAAVHAAHTVDPIVEAPARIVDAGPHLPDAKSAEQRFARFDNPVVVRVAQINNLRRAKHNGPIASRDNSITGRQAIGEHGRMIDAAVSIGVFQSLDRAVLILFGLLNRVIRGGHTAHLTIEFARLVQLLDIQVSLQVVTVDFTDENASARVEGHGNRVGQMRLTGHDLDTKAVLHAKQLLALLDRQRARRIVGQADLVLRSAGDRDAHRQRKRRQ